MVTGYVVVKSGLYVKSFFAPLGRLQRSVVTKLERPGSRISWLLIAYLLKECWKLLKDRSTSFSTALYQFRTFSHTLVSKTYQKGMASRYFGTVKALDSCVD